MKYIKKVQKIRKYTPKNKIEDNPQKIEIKIQNIRKCNKKN